MKKAIYPGSFDPITKGHLDIIERAATLFDELDVVIMKNPRKQSVFNESERKEMIQQAVDTLSRHDNIKVSIGSGLTVKYAKEHNACAIIRGIRAVTDYEYELQQATGNMMLDPAIETVLLIARPEYSFLSSSVVKEIALYDGDIHNMVPECIEAEIKGKMFNQR